MHLKSITPILLFYSFQICKAKAPADAVAEDPELADDYCIHDPTRLFYQNRETGSICCAGKVIQIVHLRPEIKGDCAISTKTSSNGTLDPATLWCAYTCQVKKLGLIDSQGRIKAQEFFNHLSVGLSPTYKTNVKNIMEKHLKCWTPMKNTKIPCYTPLAFHKCWKDAVEHLCTFGMPSNNDFSSVKKSKFDYANMVPACNYDNKRSMPGCCHGKPLPWIVSDIVRSSEKVDLSRKCMENMGNSSECSDTCFMNSIGVVDSSMELDVKAFAKHILKHFPSVKPSVWMHMLGPSFIFYDEFNTDMTGSWQETRDMSLRVCEFQSVVLELHLNKIETYCEMTSVELAEAMKDSKPASG